MDFTNKTPESLLNLASTSDDKETLRELANHLGITFSGNTGISTLRGNIQSHLQSMEASIDDDEDPADVAPDPALMAALEQHQKTRAEKPKNKESLPDLAALVTMDARKPGISETLRRAIVRAKAMRLIRVRITNLDPNDSAVPGSIFSVYNKYTGKVSKYIPFGDENETGYHVPKIILDELKRRTFTVRQEIKKAGSSFGVKQYKTVLRKKYNIEEMEPLTQKELDVLADDQKARGAIDQAA